MFKQIAKAGLTIAASSYVVDHFLAETLNKLSPESPTVGKVAKYAATGAVSVAIMKALKAF